MWIKLIEIIKNFGSFLRNYINPFLAPFFTVLNYLTLAGNNRKVNLSLPGKFFLITSIIYFFVSLGFATYQVWVKVKS